MSADAVKTDAQGEFTDRQIDEVPEDVMEAFEAYLATKPAAKEHTAARKKIRDAVPEIEEKTRFVFNGRFVVESVPYHSDEIEIPGGRRQRNRVVKVED